MSVVLYGAIFGRWIFALGSNEANASLCGVPVKRMKLEIYGCAGKLFGLAGLVQLFRLTQGDPTATIGLEFDIVAADHLRQRR